MTKNFGVTDETWWQDNAGDTNEATRTWTVDPSGDTVAPILSNVNLATNDVIPDLSEVWVQGDVNDTKAAVTAIINGGTPITLKGASGTCFSGSG